MGSAPQLDPTWLSYCQIYDAPSQRPATVDALRNEARFDRLFPGEGALPIADLLDVLPPDIPIGVEAPCARYAERAPVERARLCGIATRKFLAAYRRRTAAH